jgi:hypothetical protein
MRIALASEPGTPGAANHDWAGATACGTAVVLDGLTEAGPTGCRHGTAWYVRELGVRLLGAAADRERSLADALAYALGSVAAAHGAGCEPDHPGSPGATVAVVRTGPGRTVEFLVLSDAVIVLDAGPPDAEPTVVSDPRVDDHLPDLRAAARTDTPTPGAQAARLSPLIAAQQALRNRPGGYWVARGGPDAAAHALTGEVADVRAALLLTDGAALLASAFDALTWRELIALADGRGPGAVIATTRELEARDPDRTVWPRYKTHDDATAVLVSPR